MNRRHMGSGHTYIADEPKSKMVVAAEDAAALSTRLETCVDNFGSRVLAAWSRKDFCEHFLKCLTPAERKELKQMKIDEADNATC